MTTKTFKIGEYCKGGIITVEIKGKVISIIGKEWDFSQGSNKGSNQSNAKEFTRRTILSTQDDAIRQMDNFLNDLTSSYYSDVVLKWIKSKVEIKNQFYW